MQTTNLSTRLRKVVFGGSLKTHFLVGLAAALFGTVVPFAHAAAVDYLVYEWSPSPAGPFTAIPPDMLRVHADGSAAVVTSQRQGFFRLRIADGTRPGGGSVPIRPLDSVPATTLATLNRFIIAIAEGGSEEGANWTGATISPFVTPVTSAWNDTGEPDLVELKIIGPCETAVRGALFANGEGRRRSPDRGFILASLSRKNPPIVGYATDGPTQCESLLANCQEKPVHCIRRFGPMFLAAEDSEKNLIGNEGLYPALYSDTGYQDHSRPVSHTWDSENPNNPRLPPAPPRAVPQTFSSYPQLLLAYRRSPWLTARRRQREALIEFDWLAMEGRAPSLAVRVGEEKSFLPRETFTRFSLDDEDGRGAIITLVPRVPGVSVRGLVAGAHRLTLFPATGLPQRYLIVVSPAGALLQAAGAEPPITTSSSVWSAGTEAQQPRYDQRKDLDRWCPAVGCGPVMLALQIAWAEHNQNVPSAYWNRDPNASLTSRRDSLRQIDSPMDYYEGQNNVRMMQWYDYLHDSCDVACWVTGAGSAVPWDVGSALENYFYFTTGPVMPVLLANDVGGPLVYGGAHWEADGISDDWDESGVLVADRIKAGRPSGVYYLEHMHYCVAWRYRKIVTQFKVNGVVINSFTQRLFRVNTGWGDQDRVWNAYDIDGCYLLNLQQKRTLP